MKKRWNLVTILAVILAMTMSLSAFAGSVTSESEALKKALKNAGLKKSQVKNIDIDYEGRDNTYEVEFTVKKNGKEFDYTISAETGNITKKSVEYRYKKNSSHEKIGKKAARKKVARFSGISYTIIKNGTCRYEYDDNEGIYKVKFVKGNRRYEYDVLAPTGKIIEYEWKVIK